MLRSPWVLVVVIAAQLAAAILPVRAACCLPAPASTPECDACCGENRPPPAHPRPCDNDCGCCLSIPVTPPSPSFEASPASPIALIGPDPAALPCAAAPPAARPAIRVWLPPDALGLRHIRLQI